MDRLIALFIVATTLHDDDELQEKIVEFRKEFIIGEMKPVCEEVCRKIEECSIDSNSPEGAWKGDEMFAEHNELLQTLPYESQKKFIIGLMERECEEGCANLKACLPDSKSTDGRWKCDFIYEQHFTTILYLDLQLWKLDRFPGTGLLTRDEIKKITTPFNNKLEMTLIETKRKNSHSLTNNESARTAKRECVPRYKNGKFLFGKSSVWYTSDVDYVHASDIDYV